MAATIIVAHLNARIQPIHRGEFFEDPLNEELERASIGEVTGGGTLQMKSGEIESCDIEIEVQDASRATATRIIEILERLRAPKSSKLIVEADGSELPFGVAEGMAVYLNGTDLPDHVYKECDSNFVLDEFNRLFDDAGHVLSWWQGPKETALYSYGHSFAEMKARVAEFISSYPLCQKCRIEQVA